MSRIIVVLIKNAVPREIKLGILKLTIRRVQSNLPTVFMFVSYEEKCYYRVVSVGQLIFDCRLYCGRSRRMQGDLWNTGAVGYRLSYQAIGSCALSEFVIYP